MNEMRSFYCCLLVASTALFISAPSFGGIIFKSVHDGQWVNATDGNDLKVRVAGQVTPVKSSTTIILKIKDESITKKPDAKGNFAFEIDQSDFTSGERTEVKVSVLDKNKTVESKSIGILCCSDENAGLLAEINPKSAKRYEVRKPGFELDGSAVEFPPGKINKDGKLIVSLNHSLPRYVPVNYAPLGPPVQFAISGVDSIKGIQFSIPIDFNQPRDDMGTKITKQDWGESYEGTWPNPTKNSKIVVLGLSDLEWFEIPADKIDGKVIKFTVETGDKRNWYQRFVPVLVLPPKTE